MVDCAIVGGGAAGLSAALVLGRARRSAVVFDAGEQSNLVAPHVGGLFGHDRGPPTDVYRIARDQLSPYPTVEIRRSNVTAARPVDGGFAVAADGSQTRARRILLATGIRYELPDIPGLEPLWGDSVFHCPFCHGWEMRDRRLAVLGEGDELVARASLLRCWSDDVVALSNGTPLTDADGFDRAGIDVIVEGIVELRTSDDDGRRALQAVAFDDGRALERDGLMIHPRLSQRSPLAAELGVALTDRGTVHVDAHGRTSVRGIYAAGDVAGETQQVINAAAAGATAAYAIVHDGVEHRVATTA
jgi:thioredoxin reductase